MIPVDGLAAKIATELKVDAKDKPVGERAKTIYDSVLHTMVYSKDDKVAPGWGKGDFQRACDVGKGNCTDFHAKFMGIARAAGIPARFTMGISLPTDATGKGNGYHCWAHYLDGGHWVPVDISEAQKVLEKDPAKAAWFYGHLDADRVSMTIGRDVTLAPKQQGAPLYHFVFPYAEVDGKTVEIPKDNRGFTYENAK
jgi:transglutaminase-like putative cysteine protease